MSIDQGTTPTSNVSDERLQFFLNRFQTDPQQLINGIDQLRAERDYFFSAASEVTSASSSAPPPSQLTPPMFRSEYDRNGSSCGVSCS